MNRKHLFDLAYAVLFLGMFLGCVYAIDAIESGAIGITGEGCGEKSIEASEGIAVVWVNNWEKPVRVYGKEPKTGEVVWVFDSGVIGPGEGFSHTFNKKGTYRYLCIAEKEKECEIAVR